MSAPRELWLPPAVRESCERVGRVSPQDVRYVLGAEYDEVERRLGGLLKAAKAARDGLMIGETDAKTFNTLDSAIAESGDGVADAGLGTVRAYRPASVPVRAERREPNEAQEIHHHRR